MRNQASEARRLPSLSDCQVSTSRYRVQYRHHGTGSSIDITVPGPVSTSRYRVQYRHHGTGSSIDITVPGPVSTSRYRVQYRHHGTGSSIDITVPGPVSTSRYRVQPRAISHRLYTGGRPLHRLTINSVYLGQCAGH